ncbi:MAG: hypothetical protein IJU41_05540 [Clostridia bacterium]|nr:hypothetical protein [Clostridia bacterium]
MMNNDLTLKTAPFAGYTPDDVRRRLAENAAESELALAMALVHEKVGMLAHECDETDDFWIHYAYGIWYELECELTERILSVLADENKTKGANFALTGKGTHYLIEPFMRRNGYTDNAGWWRKDKRDK